jgi:hypothetical protein
MKYNEKNLNSKTEEFLAKIILNYFDIVFEVKNTSSFLSGK